MDLNYYDHYINKENGSYVVWRDLTFNNQSTFDIINFGLSEKKLQLSDDTTHQFRRNLNEFSLSAAFNKVPQRTNPIVNGESDQKRVSLYIENCHYQIFDFSKQYFKRIVFENCSNCEIYLGKTFGGYEFSNCSNLTIQFTKNVENLSTILEDSKFISIIFHFKLSEMNEMRIVSTNLFGVKVMYQSDPSSKRKNDSIVNINHSTYEFVNLDQIGISNRFVEITKKQLQSNLQSNTFHRKFFHDSLNDINIITQFSHDSDE
ncbi:hypothetical protein NAEGRDRAFT_82035 [Naegleria gruberi]|uniref:Uncharacterized protein n=1 Tax=Naegleria gruberi TaxID=5762 RepID=D2W1J6_NAEGR|nr:uncharacterized protein NAEGRDRAFT_82035 [Naegleria gruberi]EFC37057.1 hypothetical protein NAEGRDRAFT_82035 [Naegleria gruberi]|eukprot:XP_002669801.1 hypothetical protein NAEGRDRAFT_82035 [Naegleria gruberi strain NEG-M]